MKITFFAASGVCTCGSRECASVGSSSLQVKVGLRSQIHDAKVRHFHCGLRQKVKLFSDIFHLMWS